MRFYFLPQFTFSPVIIRYRCYELAFIFSFLISLLSVMLVSLCPLLSVLLLSPGIFSLLFVKFVIAGFLCPQSSCLLLSSPLCYQLCLLSSLSFVISRPPFSYGFLFVIRCVCYRLFYICFQLYFVLLSSPLSVLVWSVSLCFLCYQLSLILLVSGRPRRITIYCLPLSLSLSRSFP